MSDAIVRALGSVFHNNRLYGTTHNVSIMAMEHAYELLTEFLEEHGHINIRITPDSLLINDISCETKSGLAGTVVETFRAWEITDLTLEGGLTPDEFIRMVQLLEKTPEKILVAGDFGQILGTSGIGHVSSRNVTLVEVAEQEVVIDRDKVGDGSGDSDDEDLEARARRIADFVGGEGVGEPSEDVTGELKAMAGTPAELGHLLIKTAHQVVLGTAPSPDHKIDPQIAETIVGKVVECLKRAFEALKNDPSMKTQKGKKELSKTLAELEKEMSEVLETLVTNAADLDLVPVSVAVEEMTEELMVEALASEYLKKRRLIESSEKRLMRFLARKGEGEDLVEIHERLKAGGLTDEEWQELMTQTGGGAGGGTFGLPQNAGELQSMLSELVGTFEVAISGTDETRRAKLKDLVSKVQEQIRAVVGQAEERLTRMEEVAGGQTDDSDSPEINVARKLSRKEILEILAEIVQEISQPLAVASCAFQVTLADPSGFSDSQVDMLKLGNESAERMEKLVQMLGRIAGTPDSLTPQSLDHL